MEIKKISATREECELIDLLIKMALKDESFINPVMRRNAKKIQERFQDNNFEKTFL